MTAPLCVEQSLPTHCGRSARPVGSSKAGVATRRVEAVRRSVRLALQSRSGQSSSAMSVAMAAPRAKSSKAPNACWRKCPFRSISTRLGVPCMP